MPRLPALMSRAMTVLTAATFASGSACLASASFGILVGSMMGLAWEIRWFLGIISILAAGLALIAWLQPRWLRHARHRWRSRTGSTRTETTGSDRSIGDLAPNQVGQKLRVPDGPDS